MKDHQSFLADGCRRYGLSEDVGRRIAAAVDKAESAGLEIETIVDRALRLAPDAGDRDIVTRVVHFAVLARYRAERLERYRRLRRPIRIVPVPDGGTCQTVWKMVDMPYDVDLAPALPLEGCDAEVCRCTYIQTFD